MYKLLNNKENQPCGVLKIDGGVFLSIPFDPDNTDYQAYLKWLAEGNEPEPAEGAE
jgi:hypothetical protein